MTECEVKMAVRDRDGNRCVKCGMDFDQSRADYVKAIASAIRSARLARGWSQGQLADALSMRPSHVSPLEKGTHLPSVSTLIKASDALDVPLCVLLDPPTEGKKADEN